MYRLRRSAVLGLANSCGSADHLLLSEQRIPDDRRPIELSLNAEASPGLNRPTLCDRGGLLFGWRQERANDLWQNG